MDQKITRLLLISAILAAINGMVVAQDIAQWNFNGATSTSIPGGVSAPFPSLGIGISGFSVGNTASFASGASNGGSSDPVVTSPPNYGWNLTNFAAQGSGDRTRGPHFFVSTVGFQNISVSWDQRHSNTSARHVQFQFTVDGGLNWTNAGLLFEAGSGDVWFKNRMVELSSIPEANNNPNFGFRILAAFDPASGIGYAASNSGSTYAIGGTWRFDMVTVSGDPLPAPGLIRITEWMYDGVNGEFVEFTNVGGSPVDMSGWSFDDNSRTPGSFGLGSFGTVQPGESVILTENSATGFRTAWNLCEQVKIVGGLTQGLGRNDELNLYDAGGNLVDRLTYNDQGTSPFDGPRTQGSSAWVSFPALGMNTANAWILSVVGDAEGSYASAGGNNGSPGKSTMATVVYNPCPLLSAIRITEWMYQGGNGEFIEFTNVGNTSVDMTGWSFDDNSRIAGSVDLSAFGMVEAGESVILTEAAEAAFRSNWSLCENVKIIGGLSGGNNLGRSDEINLYDAAQNLIDRLTYDDQGAPPVNGPRTQGISAWVTGMALGANLANQWVLSSVGDGENAQFSLDGALGSPGRSTMVTVNYVACPPPIPDVRITEWMYQGGNGEFIEFTNVGSTPVDMSGWSFDDNSRTAGSVDLSAFGIIQAGESVILTEAESEAFKASWGLCSNVKVIGGLSGGNNLGRSDEINLYHTQGFLVDRLTYNDEGASPVNGPRTQGVSAWASAAALGNNLANQWVLSTVGDEAGSISSANGAIGNPGRSLSATVFFNPCITQGDAPTITLNTTITNKQLVAAATVSGLTYAVSGVAGDPTDPMSLYGLIFDVVDNDTPIESLIVNVTSSNPGVVPLGNIQLNGESGQYTLKINPLSAGFSLVTLSVSDGLNTTNFQVLYAGSANGGTPQITRWHTQAADASTAIDAGDGYVFIANDEDQSIRLYESQVSGLPVQSFNFDSFLGLTDLDGGMPREVDIEASTRFGNTIYWLGSHGNGPAGQNRPNRRRLFATQINGSGSNATLSYVGRYDNLREDLASWGDANGYSFSATISGTAPTDPVSFNIEGFTIAPDGLTAYIGFRAPRVPVTMRNKALIVPILNFQSWFNNGSPSGAPGFGTPIELDLGGRAIRSLECNEHGCIIIAGNTGDTPDFKLFTWSGNPADTPRPRLANLSGLSPEGFVGLPSVPFLGTLGNNQQILVISDNGTVDYYGNNQEAKDLANANHKKFRSDPVLMGEEDIQGPVITNQALSQIVDCDGLGNTASLEQWLSTRAGASAQVFCSPGTWSYELLANFNGSITSNCSTYRFTITDDCGRTANTDADFCITDSTAPVISCFNHTILFNGQSSIALQAEDLLDATDLCGAVRVDFSPSVIFCNQVGQMVPVVVNVTDNAGNLSQCIVQITVGGLPCGWNQNADGINCVAGSSSTLNAATGVWSLTSTNCYMAGPSASDAYAFAQRQLCGNGSITVFVEDISGAAPGWAGIAMRESIDPGAKMVQLLTNAFNLHRKEIRTVTNGSATRQQTSGNNRQWLRIVRNGNQFSMFTSPNGQSWFFAGVQNIPMNACIEVGLVLTNYTPNSTVTALFRNLNVSGAQTPAFLAIENTKEDALNWDSNIAISPNPSSGISTLNLHAFFGKSAEIRIFSSAGQLMYHRFLNETPQFVNLNISDFPAGLYIIRIEADGIPVQTLKLIRS